MQVGEGARHQGRGSDGVRRLATREGPPVLPCDGYRRNRVKCYEAWGQRTDASRTPLRFKTKHFQRDFFADRLVLQQNRSAITLRSFEPSDYLAEATGFSDTTDPASMQEVKAAGHLLVLDAKRSHWTWSWAADNVKASIK